MIDLRCSIRGLGRDSNNKTAVVHTFALYPCFAGVANSIRLKTQCGLKLCNALRKLLKFSLNTALRNAREIASQFSLGFFVLWTHVFSLLAHREFFFGTSSTPRGSVGPIFPRDVPFSVTV